MSEFPIRKIICPNTDASYASVEQPDHPELRGRPVAVGGKQPAINWRYCSWTAAVIGGVYFTQCCAV